MKCFNIAEAVLNLATKKYAWVIDDKLKCTFENLCQKIDDFAYADEIIGCDTLYAFDVDVDSQTREIIVGLEFDQYYLESQSSMYDVLQSANTIKITQAENRSGVIRMTMRLPGIWHIN